MDDPGCWRCNVMGHALFCGCDCHAAETARAMWRRERGQRMHNLLGSRELGPFDGIHVKRDDAGVIVWAAAA